MSWLGIRFACCSRPPLVCKWPHAVVPIFRMEHLSSKNPFISCMMHLSLMRKQQYNLPAQELLEERSSQTDTETHNPLCHPALLSKRFVLLTLPPILLMRGLPSRHVCNIHRPPQIEQVPQLPVACVQPPEGATLGGHPLQPPDPFSLL